MQSCDQIFIKIIRKKNLKKIKIIDPTKIKSKK
jgi:hypothetical protein